MNESYIEKSISDLKRSSKYSMVMVIAGAFILIASFYFSVTRLEPLEKAIKQKTSEMEILRQVENDLNERISIAKSDLASLKEKFDRQRNELSEVKRNKALYDIFIPPKKSFVTRWRSGNLNCWGDVTEVSIPGIPELSEENRKLTLNYSVISWTITGLCNKVPYTGDEGGYGGSITADIDISGNILKITNINNHFSFKHESRGGNPIMKFVEDLDGIKIQYN